MTTTPFRLAPAALLAIAALALAQPRPAAAQPTFDDFVGQYEGSWFNDTFSSTGAARIRIEVAGDTGTLGVDLDGPVFGGLDPPEVTFTGTVGSQALSKQDDSLFGDVSCTGNPSAFACTANMINDFVLSGTLDGGIASDVLDSDYSLTLLGSQMAAGRVIATKVPEPVSGIGIGAACAALLFLRLKRRTIRSARF